MRRGFTPSGLGRFVAIACLDGMALGLLLRYERELMQRGALLALVILPLSNVLLAAWLGGGRRPASPFRRGFLAAGAGTLAAILAGMALDPIALYDASLATVRAALGLPPGHPFLSHQRPWHHYAVAATLFGSAMLVATAGGAAGRVQSRAGAARMASRRARHPTGAAP
jgi:hypothetical protein